MLVLAKLTHPNKPEFDEAMPHQTQTGQQNYVLSRFHLHFGTVKPTINMINI